MWEGVGRCSRISPVVNVSDNEPVWGRVEIGDASIVTAVWGSGPIGIVMLHDGLGSISQWRSVPEMIAERADVGVLAFDRPGHGASGPRPEGPWPVDWLHHQAVVLGDLLDHLDLDDALVVGHSDGGSIALIHAAVRPSRQAGVAVFAAHSFVEPVCVERIAAMRQSAGSIVERMGVHHENPQALFEAWSGVWTDPHFAEWDIRPTLEGITVPVLVSQGRSDEYGTEAMAIQTAEAIGPNASCELIDGLGHLMHHHSPEIVADSVAAVCRSIRTVIAPEGSMVSTLASMQHGNEEPDNGSDGVAHAEPATEQDSESEAVVSDPELDQLEADLDSVEAALGALDGDDLDRAEELAASLVDRPEESTPITDD